MPAVQFFLSVTLVLGIVSGCTAPPRTGEPIHQTITTNDQSDRDSLWNTTQEVLREHGYRIARLDRRAGVITTVPETSQHFFEFWRHDLKTPYDFWESTLRTVRRTIKIELSPEANSQQTDVRVTVYRQTFSTPERQFNSSLAAFRMFGTQLPSDVTGQPIIRDQDRWLDAGRDPALERYLLEKIIQQ